MAVRRKRKPLITYLGIDPGATGGVVLLQGRSVEAYKMPTTDRDLLELLGSVPMPCTAMIEWIHPAIQGIGKSAMSKLYGNYMAIRMALAAIGISYQSVKPRTWQSYVGMSARKGMRSDLWKNKLRSRAQEIYPHLDVWSGTLTLQRSICDALLIAHYCKRYFERTER